MWWVYRLISKIDGVYTYAYSRESTAYDGVIEYNSAEQTAECMKPSKNDNQWSADYAAEKFFAVVDKGFPKEYRVVCG